MNGISRGIRNAFRNVIRTVSLTVILGISIGLALAMLVAYQAVGDKINSVTASIGNTVSVSPAGARGFEGGGTALTESGLAKLTSLSHVTGISQTLSDRLSATNTNLVSAVEAGSLGRRNAASSGTGTDTQPMAPPGGTSADTTRSFTPPVTLMGTTDPAAALSSSQGGGSLKITSGTVFDGASSADVALVGTTLATKNNLKTGSTFTAYGKAVTVAGIFDAGNTFSNNQVLMPLKAVQTLSDQAGAVTTATISVDSVDNVAVVTKAVQSALGTTADVTNAADQAQTSLAPLKSIRTISLYSLIGAVIAGAVIILLTMIMIVRERKREIGVLKAIGAGNRTIIGQFMTEAITLTVLGAVIGITAGVIAAAPITKLLVTNASNTTAQTAGRGGPGRAFGAARDSLTTVQAAVGWEIIVYGLAAALLIAVIGSSLAALFITKIRPAAVMRAE